MRRTSMRVGAVRIDGTGWHWRDSWEFCCSGDEFDSASPEPGSASLPPLAPPRTRIRIPKGVDRVGRIIGGLVHLNVILFEESVLRHKFGGS
jgi:hypothetical protein